MLVLEPGRGGPVGDLWAVACTKTGGVAYFGDEQAARRFAAAVS